ncbi:hypothetical protein [Helicobacter sp. T3_23-1059]
MKNAFKNITNIISKINTSKINNAKTHLIFLILWILCGFFVW